jgi:predicted GIY-YIG superfamily endonuclease
VPVNQESRVRPYTVHVYVPGGAPHGLRVVSKSNWVGVGLVCPRAVLPEVKHLDEFSRTGVYLLLGPSGEGEGQSVYIGQADPLRARLERHYTDEDFWTRLVAFVSREDVLHRAHAQHLEARLIQQAREARRAVVENRNSPREPGLSEPDREEVESFLADMLSVLSVLEVTAFEPAPARTAAEHLLFLTSAAIVARGYESPQGFIVTEGSQASIQESEVAVAWLSARRADLLARGVLVDRGEYLEFTQDQVFPSPSTAGGVVLGREVNGRTGWRDAQGRTLRQIQEAEGSV